MPPPVTVKRKFRHRRQVATETNPQPFAEWKSAVRKSPVPIHFGFAAEEEAVVGVASVRLRPLHRRRSGQSVEPQLLGVGGDGVDARSHRSSGSVSSSGACTLSSPVSRQSRCQCYKTFSLSVTLRIINICWS